MTLYESIQRLLFFHFEWIALLAGLIVMAFINPASDSTSLCFFDFISAPFCPGEGFGRSIALFFRGDVVGSLQMHPFGIAGVAIISHRIYSIFKRNNSIRTFL